MKKGAVITTAAAVIFCMLLLVALSIAAPELCRWYGDFRGITEKSEKVIMIAFYICTLPAMASLVSLLRILDNIRREDPFKAENHKLMSFVSYCCIAVAVVTLFAGRYYMPMLFVTAAMIFIFLIVRVVRGCFISAMYLKEENSLTI